VKAQIIAGVVGALAVSASLTAGLTLLPSPDGEIVAYATSLTGRTPSQRHNAELSAQSLDGAVVRPGQTFSFCHTVKSWSFDRGYVKAPVSFDGELIPAFGGGVCQTSTTLYNAALLAGLPIVERHHHVFAPHYVPPGRDAAVAYPEYDLRFRNPYSYPLLIHARVEGSQLEVSFRGMSQTKRPHVELVSRVLSITRPERIVHVYHRDDTSLYHRNAGTTGYRLITYRVFSEGGREVRREQLSDDSYPAMNAVVTVAD